MTILPGDNGRVSVGSLKTFTFTPGATRQSEFSPITMPTSEPGTAQITYTVQEGDLFTVSPIVPFKNIGILIASGKTVTSASISYRLYKNGASVANGTNASTPANQYWAHSHASLGDVQVGDVIELKLWSNQVDTYVDFYGFFCNVSQPDLTAKRGGLVKDVNVTVQSAVNTFTPPASGGTISVSNASGLQAYPANNTSANVAMTSGTPYMFYFRPNSTYGFFRVDQGELTTAVYAVNSAVNRSIRKGNHPTTISFREVNL